MSFDLATSPSRGRSYLSKGQATRPRSKRWLNGAAGLSTLTASPLCKWEARPTSAASCARSALAGSASGWLGCVTPPKKATSGVLSSGPASAPACPAPIWKRSVSTCVPPDLEDELIRALGVASVEHIIQAHGEIRSFRVLQKQPAQQGQSPERQLHRFMGTRAGRKSQYARLLVDALDLARVPRPLDRVLAHSTR